MNWSRVQAYLRKDGWLLAALGVCIVACMLIGAGSQEGEEARIGRVLSAMDGAGRVEVAVYCEDSVPCGAVVVAQGAGDVGVRIRLTDAVSTLLGLDATRVAVYEGMGGR